MRKLLLKLVYTCFFLFSGVVISGVYGINDPKYPFHPQTDYSFVSSNLPIVVIDLDERMANKEEDKRVPASMKIIWNKSGTVNQVTETESFDYDGKIGIKYRGNSSYSLSDKKPFALRIQDENGKKQKASILGMGEDEDWALLAPYADKSMIRDVLLFELMRGTFEYTPSGRYCELVLNGVYQGVYIMAARVRQGSKRINIEAPTADVGDGVTGGYHLEIDRSDEPGFAGSVYPKDLRENSIYVKTFYQYKYPDQEELSTAQQNYIQTHVRNMEEAIAGDNFKNKETGYRAYLDTASLMDFYLAQELSKNIDAYRLSTPLYKYSDDVDKRFKFSIWDFNISMGNANYKDGWSPEGWAFNTNRFSDNNSVPWMFKRILQDEEFCANLKERWGKYRGNRLSENQINAKIDSLTSLLQEAQVRNFTVWNRFYAEVWPNYYIATSWEDEISYLKGWLGKRTKWLDNQWTSNDVNHVVNAGFEATSTRGTKPESWLPEWSVSSTNAVYLSTTDKRSGIYGLLINADSKASQILTEVTPGIYTLKVWVKTLSDPGGYVYVKYHTGANGQDEKRKTVTPGEEFTLLEIDNIEVSNSFVEIGFGAQGKAGNIRLWVDDVEFSKQKTIVGNTEIKKEPEWLEIKANRAQKELTILINGSIPSGLDIEVFEITGRKAYAAKITSEQTVIQNIFKTNQLYIVRVGNEVRKVLM